MAAGTTDRASDTADAVLDSALAEMESEGYDTDAPIGTAPEDGSTDDAGSNDPADASEATANPREEGEPGQAETAADETPRPEGHAASESTDEAQAADTTDDSPDPLQGAEPFTFTVDGQARTMEGVYRIPGEGIIVPEEKVPHFQLIASRAEGLERQNAQLYQKSQEYERLSTWKQRGSDGTEETLTGRPAIEAQRVTLGRTLAALDTLASALRDPATFASLVSVDEAGNIVPDRTALQHLITKSELAELNAEQAVRRHMQGLSAATPASAPTPDLAEVAPVLVQNLAAQAGVTGLSSDDSQFLTQMLPRFVREATQADIAQNPQLKLGESVIDPSFMQLVTRQASMRGETSKVQKAAEKAATFNAGQQKGRQGTTGKPQAKKSAAGTPTTTDAPKVGRQERWDSVLQNALQEMSTTA